MMGTCPNHAWDAWHVRCKTVQGVRNSQPLGRRPASSEKLHPCVGRPVACKSRSSTEAHPLLRRPPLGGTGRGSTDQRAIQVMSIAILEMLVDITLHGSPRKIGEGALGSAFGNSLVMPRIPFGDFRHTRMRTHNFAQVDLRGCAPMSVAPPETCPNDAGAQAMRVAPRVGRTSSNSARPWPKSARFWPTTAKFGPQGPNSG